MKKYLVSACLLGLPCRYDGKSKPCERVLALKNSCTFIPVCPEQMGGLPTPRPPAERAGDKVINDQHQDVTAQYRLGADMACQLYQMFDCDGAILKRKSPSCGRDEIYDGSFTRTLVPGMGAAAEALSKAGCPLFDEDHLPQDF